MKISMKDKKVSITEIPVLDKPYKAKTGKSLVAFTTGKFQDTGIKIQGKKLLVTFAGILVSDDKPEPQPEPAKKNLDFGVAGKAQIETGNPTRKGKAIAV